VSLSSKAVIDQPAAYRRRLPVGRCSWPETFFVHSPLTTHNNGSENEAIYFIISAITSTLLNPKRIGLLASWLLDLSSVCFAASSHIPRLHKLSFEFWNVAAAAAAAVRIL